MKIVILIEDLPNEGLLWEHGISAYIEFENTRILFDTGQTGAFIDNAAHLGVNLDKVNYLVLSHGHYDHTGGLRRLVDSFDMSETTLIAHPLIFEKKLRADGTEIGNSMTEGEIKQHFGEIILTRKPYALSDDIVFTGEIPRIYENPGTVGYHIDAGRLVPDPVVDDSSLFFRTNKGTVVVVGCSHTGILNITKHAGLDSKVHSVIGGFHLIGATQERIKNIVSGFSELGVQILYPGHCTGERAIKEMKKVFGNRVHVLKTGKVIRI